MKKVLRSNIKLKKGFFWFGDMSAGIGVGMEDTRYIVNQNYFIIIQNTLKCYS